MQISLTVQDSVRKFIRLTALSVNPQYTKRIRDEFDLMDAIDVVAIYFKETERMLDKKMYQGQPFDPIEDVKRATEEYFLTGREVKDTALARGRNLTMYHLAVVPIIEMFKGMKHKEILDCLDVKLDQVKILICSMDLQTHYDDALVTLAQVSQMIKEREQARKIELAKRKRGKRRKKTNNLLDWVEKNSRAGKLDF